MTVALGDALQQLINQHLARGFGADPLLAARYVFNSYRDAFSQQVA